MSKKISVVYVDSQRLLAVEVGSGSNTFKLLRFTERPLPDGGMTAEWLKAVWREQGFSGNQVVCVLPPELVAFKSLQLPQLPREQLEAALRLEYEPKNQLYKVMAMRTNTEGIEVETAVVADLKLQNHLGVFEAAGLNVLWFGLRFRGLQAFLNFHVGYLESVTTQLYLDNDGGSLEMGLIDDDRLLYRRNLGGALNAVQLKTAEAVADLWEEIRLFLAVGLRQTAELPGKLWLFGDLQPELLPSAGLADEFKVELDWPRKSRLSGVLTGAATPRLAALLGIALDALDWDPHPELRFQTQAQQQRMIRRDRWRSFAKAGVIVFLVLCGLSLGLKAQAVKEAANSAWLEQNSRRFEQLKLLSEQTQQNLRAIHAWEDWLQNRGAELEFMRILQANLAAGTTIEDLLIEDGKLKNLSGVTPSVSVLLHKFHQNSALRDLKLKGSITSAKDGREQFQLEGAVGLKEALQ